MLQRAWNALVGTAPSLTSWMVANAVAGMTPRQQRLQALLRLYWGRQYDGRPAWDVPAGTTPVPARERRPSTRGGLATDVVDRYLSLFVGAGRLPVLSVPGDPAATRLLQNLLAKAGFGGALSDAMCYGLTAGSGIVVAGFGRGWPRLRVEDPTWCQPVFAEAPVTDADRAFVDQYDLAPDDLVRLDITYITTSTDERGNDQDVWHRETLTPVARVVFKPVPVTYADKTARTNPQAPDMNRFEPDPDRSATHGFGFVPAEWFRPLGEYGGELDGPSLLGDPDGPVASMCAEWDYTMSFAGRAVQRSCAPTLLLKGFGADMPRFDPSKPLIGPRPESDARYLETSLDAVTKAHDQADRLKKRVYELCSVVMHDATEGGEPSGEALRLKYVPMTAQVDEWRAEVSPQVRRLGQKMLRAVLHAGLPTLAPELVRDDDGGVLVVSPKAAELRVVDTWPEVFPRTAADRERAVRTAVAARAARLVRLKDAVAYLARHAFDGLDVDATVADLEKEQDADTAAYLQR